MRTVGAGDHQAHEDDPEVLEGNPEVHDEDPLVLVNNLTAQGDGRIVHVDDQTVPRGVHPVQRNVRPVL